MNEQSQEAAAQTTIDCSMKEFFQLADKNDFVTLYQSIMAYVQNYDDLNHHQHPVSPISTIADILLFPGTNTSNVPYFIACVNPIRIIHYSVQVVTTSSTLLLDYSLNTIINRGADRLEHDCAQYRYLEARIERCQHDNRSRYENHGKYIYKPRSYTRSKYDIIQKNSMTSYNFFRQNV
jgi:hypothetical protein